MKREIAALLRHRSSWQLIGIATVGVVVALAIVFSSYQSTLRTLKPVLIALFGGAGAALLLAFVRRSEEIAAGTARGWGRMLAAILAIAATTTFVTYSLVVHERESTSSCNAAILADTLAEREADLAAAEARLRGPFALFHQRINDRATRECERTREDLERLKSGLCTRWPLKDQTCRCGEETFPYARCEEPRCLHEPGWPDLFYCVGDDLPPGRSM
ncbi:MAG: hypothetical protein R3B09_06485 [Nannocystaceae bacterium]